MLLLLRTGLGNSGTEIYSPTDSLRLIDQNGKHEWTIFNDLGDITDSASPQLAQPSLTEAYHIGVLNPAQCDRLAHGRVSGLAEASPGATRSQGFGSRGMSLCRVKPKSAGLVGSVSSIWV